MKKIYECDFSKRLPKITAVVSWTRGFLVGELYQLSQEIYFRCIFMGFLDVPNIILQYLNFPGIEGHIFDFDKCYQWMLYLAVVFMCFCLWLFTVYRRRFVCLLLKISWYDSRNSANPNVKGKGERRLRDFHHNISVWMILKLQNTDKYSQW